jgi:hypothetical protein
LAGAGRRAGQCAAGALGALGALSKRRVRSSQDPMGEAAAGQQTGTE